MKINLSAEIINHHSDDEIIEYLDGVLSGLVRNYNVSLEKGDSNILWSNLGDLTMVAGVVRALRKRNQERLAATKQ